MNILTKQQSDAITMSMQGIDVSTIAKRVGVSRQTIYAWFNKDYVKAELSNRRKDMATRGNNRIMADLDKYIENIKELANDKSDKRTCLRANIFLLEKIYGTKSIKEQENEQEVETQPDVKGDELENKLKSHLKAIK